jgi:hypothetical protein
MTSVYTITMTQHELSTEKHVTYIYTTKHTMTMSTHELCTLEDSAKTTRATQSVAYPLT